MWQFIKDIWAIFVGLIKFLGHLASWLAEAITYLSKDLEEATSAWVKERREGSQNKEPKDKP